MPADTMSRCVPSPHAEVARAAAEGIAVDVVGLGEARPTLTRLGAATPLTRRVAEGASVEVAVDVHGAPNERVRVDWYRDGDRVGSRWLTLDAEGRTRDVLTDRRAPAGMHQYEAQILEADGGDGGTAGVDRSRRRAAALVTGKPKVLVVTLLGERPTLLVDALRQADADVEHLQLADPDGSGRAERLDAARLSGVDLVVLADLPLERPGEVSLIGGLSADAQRALVEYVSERGGGLFVTGGAFGLGPDWADAPLTRLLPVGIQDQGELDDPPVALAVMLDRSGSMGMRVGTHTKMELAVEASLAAAAALRSGDRVAIAAVDVASTWHQPLRPVEALVERRERVRGIRAGGGGIYVYTALVDAYQALQDAPEPIRHVILFSDTADSEEQWQGCPFRPCSRRLPWAVDLARDARATGVTTSVVGIGRARDTDTTFLQELAAAGGGRFYLTSQGTDLRRIFVTETRAAALSNLREEPTPVALAQESPMTRGLGAFPALNGFVESTPRPTADTALVTDGGEPLLASWRYGLGTVVAFTSDAGGRWSRAWGDWPGAGQLMRQIARHAQRQRAPAQADARLMLDGRQLELGVDVPAGEAPPAQLELFAYGADGEAEPLPARLERAGPGRWAARVQAPAGPGGGGPTVALARIRDARGHLLGEVVAEQTSASELAGLGPDAPRLDALAREGGGRRDPEPAEAASAVGASAPVPEPTWPWMLLAAALLVCVDLGVRRLEGRAKGRAGRGSAAADPAPVGARSGGEEEVVERRRAA